MTISIIMAHLSDFLAKDFGYFINCMCNVSVAEQYSDFDQKCPGAYTDGESTCRHGVEIWRFLQLKKNYLTAKYLP